MTMPRPLPAIVKPGGDPDAELQALQRASFARSLTRDEQARVKALSFAPDAELERIRCLKLRHPGLYGAVLGQLRERLEGVEKGQGRQEGYERRRAAAVAAGRAVPEPDARAIAYVDQLAAEYGATAADPFVTLDADHRAAFRAAVLAGDFGAVVREWSAWLAANVERNAFARRRAAALTALGHSTSADVRRPPSFVPELEDSLGGGTIRETMPFLR